MCLSSIACFSAEAALGFSVKNCVCFYGLAPIRTQLQQVISEIALPRFGSFVAPMVGSQIGLMAALPVTLFYGEMMAFTVKKTITSVHTIFISLWYGVKNSDAPPALCKDVVMNVIAFGAGFFAKTYFCNYAMPHVGSLLRHSIVLASPVLGLSLPMIMLMPAIVVLISPAVTFALGDFVAFGTNRVTYGILNMDFSKRMKPLLPIRGT